MDSLNLARRSTHACAGPSTRPHALPLPGQHACHAHPCPGEQTTCRTLLGRQSRHRYTRHQIRSRATVTELALLASDTDWLYEAGQAANQLVSNELSGITPLTYLVVLASGLATSLSPCTLSVLPLTIGYIGGYARAVAVEAPPGESSDNGTPAPPAPPRNSPGLQAASFSLGLATTLAALGVISSSVGSTYGAIGAGLPIAVSCLAILMGLNLLEVLPLALPSLNVDTREALQGTPPALQAYVAGLAFALAASPCSTPVLATLLGWVATSQDPVQGGFLLLAYTTGYVAPLLLAATVTGSLKQLMAMRQFSAWITPASGALLVAGGTYTLLGRLPI